MTRALLRQRPVPPGACGYHPPVFSTPAAQTRIAQAVESAAGRMSSAIGNLHPLPSFSETIFSEPEGTESEVEETADGKGGDDHDGSGLEHVAESQFAEHDDERRDAGEIDR